ncbi:SusC/RagA family TonB-linked outer membrane protein [Ferruginibacter sp.]
MKKKLQLFLCCCLALLTAFGQTGPVTGSIKNASGEPLAGATVQEKGTSNSVVTDAQGNFSIKVSTKNPVLQVSFVGYENQELKLSGKTSAMFVLRTAASVNLNDVVVIGYGTTKRRDLTGSIVSVKPAEITARPGPNAMESLQGRVAGLDITRTSGQPGTGVNIQLRGTRSFTASGTPLFIINGLPGDYATLNPYDIESIEVLKDASSTAVYGSAGSNGVIIITTKSAKAGKMSIDFNAYYGHNGSGITPKMRSYDSYLQAKRDAYKYVYDATNNKWTTTGALWQSPADDSVIFGTARWNLYKQGQFVDWAGTILRDDAATQNYSLGISGGSEKTKGYISFNYTDEVGQYSGDRYKLYATTMRIDHSPRKWLTIGSSLQGSYVDRNKAQDKLENMLTTDPLIQPYKADGTLQTDLGNNVYNLLLDYQPGVYGNVDNNLKLFFNPYVEFKPIKGLSILSRVGVQMSFSNSYRFDGIGSVSYTYANANVAKAQVNQNRAWGYQWENILNYNYKLKEHEFGFTGVSSWFYTQNNNTTMNQSNIVSNNFKWYKFTGDANTLSSSSYTMAKTFGFLARLNYSYKGKYLLSGSVRRDGSSVLYEKNRWDNFPAASAGWRISEENFMAGTKNWLSSLKLRAGWGITGSAKIDPYSSVAVVESSNMSLGGVTQAIFRNSQYITNPELGWEKSHNTNIGLEASLFKNRIDLTAEYYITKTTGVIYSVTSPVIYGTYRPGSPYQTFLNIAETKNKGFELTLNTRNIVRRDFEWSTNIAYSTNSEKILALIGGQANNIANGNYTLTLGEAVNSYRNYKLDGVWQIGEEQDALVFNKRPGDLKVNVPGMTRLQQGVYVRTAADGTPTYYYNALADVIKYAPGLTAASSKYTYNATTDYQILGHNTPNWTLGFQNRFRYKDFDLTIYAFFRWGQMISYNMMGWYQPSAFATNASPSRTFPTYFNYWTPENPSNDFPVMNYQLGPSNFPGFTGLNYVDGSFFKIKNISLGYTLPERLVKKAAIQRFRIYATVTNPLIVAKSHLIKDYDPEMNGELGYPLTKQIVAGVNLTF